MTIYSAHVFVGQMFAEKQVIIVNQKKLLVVQWLFDQELTQRRPELVIPLARLQHEDFGHDPTAPSRFVVTESLPESLFDGTLSDAERNRLGVRKGPDVTYPLDDSQY